MNNYYESKPPEDRVRRRRSVLERQAEDQLGMTVDERAAATAKELMESLDPVEGARTSHHSANLPPSNAQLAMIQALAGEDVAAATTTKADATAIIGPLKQSRRRSEKDAIKEELGELMPKFPVGTRIVLDENHGEIKKYVERSGKTTIVITFDDPDAAGPIHNALYALRRIKIEGE